MWNYRFNLISLYRHEFIDNLLYDLNFRFITLYPGDVVITGTPPGVGCFRKPPVYLKVSKIMLIAKLTRNTPTQPMLGIKQSFEGKRCTKNYATSRVCKQKWKRFSLSPFFKVILDYFWHLIEFALSQNGCNHKAKQK